MDDEPVAEAVEFLGGRGDPNAKLVVVAGGKTHTFAISEARMFWALQSVAHALQRMNDKPVDLPPA